MSPNHPTKITLGTAYDTKKIFSIFQDLVLTHHEPNWREYAVF